MTRLPLEDRDVVGHEGPEYEPQRQCAHPYCGKGQELQSHHLWRRSFLGGPFDWVVLPDGQVVGNKVYLCPIHHKIITENRAFIELHLGSFYWFDDADEDGVPLSPQPPSPSYEGFHEEADRHTMVPEGGTCPTCKRKVPKKKEASELEPERKRTTISFRAPKDSEDGVEIIDTLLEECAKLFGRPTVNEETGKELRGWKYLVLVESLALVVQHGHLLVRDPS